MYAVSQAYRDAIMGTRKINLYISIGFGVDATAADDLTTTADGLPFADPAQLKDAIYTCDEHLATYEGNGIPTATAMGMVAPPPAHVTAPPYCGWWSAAISDASRSLAATLSLDFAGVSHTSAFTIYFGDVYATAFTLTYLKAGAAVRTVAVTANAKRVWSDTESATYDAITLAVTAVSAAYRHLRIAEFEFGSSKVLSSDELTGAQTILLDSDPLGVTCPVNEADLTLGNVRGRFDPDGGDAALLNGKAPLNISLALVLDGTEETVPLGIFYLRSRKATDTSLTVTAQDARALLQDRRPSVAFTTDVSYGATVEALLTAEGIKHTLPLRLFSLYPSAALTIADEDGLTLLNNVALAVGMRLTMGRDGTLTFRAWDGADDYGTILRKDEYTFPNPDGAEGYNQVAVGYGTAGAVYTLDLRTDTKVPANPLSVDDPLIATEAEAQTLAAAVAGRIYAIAAVTEWRGDMSIEPGDTLKAQTRLTSDTDSLPSQRLKSVDLSYEGYLKATLTGVY